MSYKSKSNIKVLNLVTRLNVGGPAVILNNLLQDIDRDSFEILIATGTCSKNEKDIRVLGPEFERLNSSIHLKNLQNSIRPLKDILSIFEIVRLIGITKPDLIHTHTFKAGLLGRIASIISRQKIVVVHTFHGHLLEGYFGPIKKFLLIRTEKLLGKFTNHFVVIGEKVASDLLRVGILEIGNYSIFFPNVLPKKSDRSESTANSMIKSDFIVTFIGRLTQIKRPDRVLQIAKLLKSENIRFQIVGGGEMQTELEIEIEHKALRIDLMGWRSDITSILMNSDVVLLTSENEGIPLVLVEATAQGKPILATKVGSVGDVVSDRFNGRILDFQEEIFAEILRVMSKDPEIMTNYSKNSLRIFSDKFNNLNVVKKYEQLYRTLILEAK